ncbi:MAG: ABC transporter substrate-binding protein [Deltaproteobacteria bacterium]|nr:ABC transporter substrate-binding protein [Deltaproteobacteria bacterium]
MFFTIFVWIPIYGQNLVLGAILGLSGASFYNGKAIQEGIELALNELKNSSLKVIFEDYKQSSNEAVKAFHTILLKKPKGIITMSSTSSVPINPLATKHNIIQLAILSWATSYSTPEDFSFRLDITTDSIAKEFCSFVERKRFTEIALVFIKTNFGTSMRDSVRKVCGDRIVFEYEYLESDKDINSLALKAIRSSPSLILVVDHRSSMIGDFVKRLRAFNYKGSIYSGTLGQDNLFLSTAGEFSEGTYYIYVASNEEKILEIYRKRYHNAPINPYLVSLGYEAVKILHSAFESCSDTDCARNKLYSSEFDTVFGKLKFDINGDAVGIKPETRVIRNGKFEKANF